MHELLAIQYWVTSEFKSFCLGNELIKEFNIKANDKIIKPCGMVEMETYVYPLFDNQEDAIAWRWGSQDNDVCNGFADVAISVVYDDVEYDVYTCAPLDWIYADNFDYTKPQYISFREEGKSVMTN